MHHPQGTHRRPVASLSKPRRINHENHKGGDARTKFLGISRSDGAAVNDPRRFRNALGHLRLQKLTDLGMGVLRLGRSGDLARADRPHRLVRNHDIAAKRNSVFVSGRKRQKNVPPVSGVLEDVHDSLEL
jgi:hypothetical protein